MSQMENCGFSALGLKWTQPKFLPTNKDDSSPVETIPLHPDDEWG
jgi:hypothetical protein